MHTHAVAEHRAAEIGLEGSTAATATVRPDRSIGWNAAKAESGHVAMQKIRARRELKGHYNVVLIDWKMPTMDGLATAKKIRTEFSDEPMAIMLMVTAFSREELMRQPGMDIVNGIVSKPVTSSSLFNTVAEALCRFGQNISGFAPRADGAVVKYLTDLRILIVDDSEINREVAMRIVEKDGAIVSLANNGKEAIDFLCAHPDEIDIVLMDVQMPIMDGYQATRQLRAMPQFAGLPVVALTAGAFRIHLSAHTHGGQIMLTENIGGGPLKFRYWSGVHHRNGSTLAITNGVGNWFPLRVNAPAEILKVVLRNPRRSSKCD